MTERDYILVGEEKRYVWFNIYEDAYKDGNILQNFIMSYIDFEYEDIDIDFKEKEVKAYKEVLKSDGTWQNTYFGSYIVTSITQSDTNESVKVKGYDYGLKYTEQYDSSLDYASGTITLQMVSDEINTKLGMNLAVLDVNQGFIVDSDQFTGTGTSNGSVISYIAGMSGNRARIVEDQLVYQFKNETSKVLNKSDYTELEDKRDTHPWTILVLGQADIQGQEAIRRDEELIALYGENYVRINDNPFAYTIEKREALIDGIFNKIKGFGYSSFVAKATNEINFNIGDVFEFETADGTLTKSIVLRKTTKSTEIELEAPSITNASIEYIRPQTALNIAKKAEIIANQANNTVTIEVSKIEDVLEQTTDEISRVETETNNAIIETNEQLNNYATVESVSQISTSLQQTITSTELNLNLIEDIQTNGVVQTRTENNFTFNKDGLTLDEVGAKTKTILDNANITVIDKSSGIDTEIFTAGYDEVKKEVEVRTQHINIREYLVLGANSRFEDYQEEGEEAGTACFDI